MAKDYRKATNDELIDLLFTEEDRLPHAAVDEIVRRGEELIEPLGDILLDRTTWTAELPDWWATVHATYLVGAIGGERALVPLLSALRWSDAYDNEWVTEDLPSILSSLGEISSRPLFAVALDRSAGWSARSIAMDALGGHAVRDSDREEEVMALLLSILKDCSEEYGARRSAAYVLLDFRRADAKPWLMELAREELERMQQQEDYRPAFTPDGIEGELASPRRGMELYTQDWFIFYEPAEIRRRQMRWESEDGRAKGGPGAAGSARALAAAARHMTCPCGSGRPYAQCCLIKKLH